MQSAPYARHAVRGFIVACVFCSVLLSTIPVFAETGVNGADVPKPQEASFSVDWLEPRGLNIVDMVGDVPDSFLAGSIISYTPGYGIVRYNSGKRDGDTVTVTAQAYPRFVVDGTWNGSMFGCLGQGARIDQLGSVSPASLLRVYYEDRDVTREVDLFTHVPAGRVQPILNPGDSEGMNLYRYYETPVVPTQFSVDGALIVPANMGCELIVSNRDYRELTLKFTVQAPKEVSVRVLSTQSFTFHSYNGPGYIGLLDSLRRQLNAAGYPFRAEYFDMNIPAGADYFLLNFPPLPADAYTAFPGNPRGNLDRISSGTYRTNIPNGLSVDHVNSMGLPLFGHWQDSDQGPGTWLNYTPNLKKLAAPEYIVPAGVSYHPCMNQGGCSAALLAAVYNTSMTMEAAYLSVERVSVRPERLPVQMVGSEYHRSVPVVAPAADTSAAVDKPFTIFLPGAPCEKPRIPPDDPTGCSWKGGCGWFTQDGRMVDYIPWK